MRNFKFLVITAALATTTGLLVSCGGDDDDDWSSQISNNIGVLKGGNKIDSDLPDGYRVVSVLSRYGSGITAKYDVDGALVSISDGYDTYAVTSNPFTITCEDTGYGYSSKEEYKIYLNNSGYITKISAMTTYNYNDDFERSKHSSGVMKFSYNLDNQLSSISSSYKGEFYEDGQKYNETGSSEYTFTYKNECLTKVVNKWEEKDTHVDKGTETYIYSYDGSYENPYSQYTHYLISSFDADAAGEALAYLGLFGRASISLPTSMEESHRDYCSEDDVWEEDSRSRNCGPYSYNKYNALEKADGYTYSYKSITASRSDNEPTFVSPSNTSLAKSLHNLIFRRAHKCRK